MKEGNIPLEKLLIASQGSLYRLALLVAKRGSDLAEGKKSLIDKPSEKGLDNALREIEAGRIVAKKATVA
jgi:DNA-directed RNA polymerase subunit K/omega